MSAGRDDAPPAIHGREFTIKTEDDEVVVVGKVGSKILFQDDRGNEMGIGTPDVPYTEHNHAESGMASAAVVIGDSTVEAGDLQLSAVLEANIAPSAVTAGKVGDSAVTARKIGPSAVGTGQVSDSAVTAGKVADSAVGVRELDKTITPTLAGRWSFNGGVSISGADVEERYFSAPPIQGAIASGNATILYQTHISAGETMAVTQAGLTDDDGSPAASNVSLGIARLDGAGGGAWKDSAITGDGATVFDSRQGNPLASYTSPSAGQVGVMVDNGHFSAAGGFSAASAIAWATAIGRVS